MKCLLLLSLLVGLAVAAKQESFVVKRTGISGSSPVNLEAVASTLSGKADTARGYGYAGNYGGWGYNDHWFLSLLVITLPLVVLPYVAFLFLIYNSPFGLDRHYHHIHGHHHHRSSPYYGYGLGRAAGEELLTERILSSINGLAQ